MTIHCPDCGSAACRSVAAVHMSGTRLSSRNFGGVGISRHGNIGAFGGVSSGTSSSILALACEPPTRPERASLTGIAFTFLWIGLMAGCVAMIVLLIAGAFVFGDDAHTPFILIYAASVYAGVYAGYWWIAREPLRRYGKNYDALMEAYEKASATYERLWICNKCLHTWEREARNDDAEAEMDGAA